MIMAGRKEGKASRAHLALAKSCYSSDGRRQNVFMGGHELAMMFEKILMGQTPTKNLQQADRRDN